MGDELVDHGLDGGEHVRASDEGTEQHTELGCLAEAAPAYSSYPATPSSTVDTRPMSLTRASCRHRGEPPRATLSRLGG